MVHPSQIMLAATASIGNWVLLPGIILVVVAVALVSVFVLALRARHVITASGFPVGAPIDRQDRRYWKNGFYVNPQDPGLWVTRPLGQTLNLGHPQGVLVLGALLAGILLLLCVVTLVPTLLIITALR